MQEDLKSIYNCAKDNKMQFIVEQFEYIIEVKKKTVEPYCVFGHSLQYSYL